MKKVLLALLIAALVPAGHAELLARYSFDNTKTNSAASSLVAVSDVTGAGTYATTVFSTDAYTGTHAIQDKCDWFSADISNVNYLKFTLTVDGLGAGELLSVTNISVPWKMLAVSAGKWYSVKVFSVVNGDTASADLVISESGVDAAVLSWRTPSENPGLIGLENGDVVEFRFWQTGAPKNGVFDEITVEGSVGSSAPTFLDNPINGSHVMTNLTYESTLSDDAIDPNGDPLTFAKVPASHSGPGTDWLSVGADGALSGIPTAANAGTNSWSVTVDDGTGNTDAAALQIVVRTTTRPNVLLVIADDLLKQMELYGNPAIKTPYLNALATEGMLFDRAYCQYPLCGPSRAALMMGKYPSSTGIIWNGGGKAPAVQSTAAGLGVETMPAFFKARGYVTVGGGKLYHDSVITEPTSPDYPATTHDFNIALSNAGKDGDSIWADKDGDGIDEDKYDLVTYNSPYTVAEHKDGAVVEQAKDWLAEYINQETEEPFLMCIGIKKPHAPYACPSSFWDMYVREDMAVTDIQQPNDILEYYSLSHTNVLLSNHPDTWDYAGYDLPEAKKKEMMHGYSACVSYADFLVGDLVNTLKEKGLYGNTIIVFTSDHGYKLGEYDRWGKFTLHEKDTVVPLLVRVPELTQSHDTTTESIVGLIDICPTLAELCGLSVPPNTDGVSFSATMSDPAAYGRDYVHTFVGRAPGTWLGVPYPLAVGASVMHRNGYRYTHWMESALVGNYATAPSIGPELYDHYNEQNTPISTSNLVASLPALVGSMEVFIRNTARSAGYDYDDWVADFGLSGGDAAPAFDYDGDGLTNLQEYSRDGNPDDALDTGSPVLGEPVSAEGGEFEFVWRKRINANNGLTYTVEQTDDLTQSWSNSTDVVSVGQASSGGDFTTVTNQVPTAGKSAEFLRLRIDNQ